MNNKKNPFKIGIVTNDIRGGGIYIFSDKLKRFLKKSARLVVLGSSKKDYPFEEIINVNRIYKRRVLANINDIKEISKDIDLWHINFVSTSLYPLIIGNKKKKIITFHFMLGNKALFLFGKNFIISLFRKVFDDLRLVLDVNVYILFGDQFVFLTKAQFENFKKYTLFKEKIKKKSCIINNFIEKDKIIKSKRNFNNKVVFVGRYTKIKGFEDLIKLAERVKEVNFSLIGDNNFKSNFKNITNIGVVNNKNILKYYDKNSIFLLPSYTEAFPITILEAMARGLVILVSDIPGMREIIKEGRNGYLFPPGDVEKMKELILYLKNNPKEIERISKNNLKDIWKFTTEKQVPKYIKVYEEVLKESKTKKN